MPAEETPSAVLYSLLKALKISNKDAASIMLSEDVLIGGQTPRERVEERTYRYRIVHAKPGEYPLTYFSDFTLAAQLLTSRILKNKTYPITSEELLDFLTSEGVPAMREACAEYGLDSALLNNVVEKICTEPDLSDTDKASMVLLSFIVTGCTGSTSLAAEEVEHFAHSIASRGFKTGIAEVDDYDAETEPREIKLGLARVIDGAIDLGNVQALNTGAEGTIIGSLSTDQFSINDVGPLVSKRHVRVYRDDSGKWFAVGLDSTNGTELIRGSDKASIVIEEPRAQRKNASKPVEIKPGDTLHLAGTTVFLALLVR